MVMDKKKRWYQIGMLIFLAMVVIGFVVPGVLYSGSDSSVNTVEPRLCQTDADCYLMCDELPQKVLCSQNLCQRNSCTEQDFYNYTSPQNFQLKITVNGTTIDLTRRSNSGNMYVTFGELVAVYTGGLSLAQVLEKANIALTAECITLDTTYCQNDKNTLVMNINGNQSFSYQSYVPQAGDRIEVIYS